MKKSIDLTMNCKTTNALLYVMASIHKKQEGLDDVIILNQEGRVAETTASNIFVVKNGAILTPSLSEGPVAGSVRAQLFDVLPGMGFDISESRLEIEDLLDADELFLTNSMMGVQPVKAFDNQEKAIEISLQILEALEKSILE